MPTITLSAQPSTIANGSSAVLNWTSNNATSVAIQGLGVFGANGSVNVTPNQTTTYTAVATGPAGTAQSTTTVTVTNSPAPPRTTSFGHVFLLLEENHSYSSVIGSGAMPYLNSLASQYGLATQYYANTHPSIGNYFMLTTGQIITNDDSFAGTVNVDNLVRHLLLAGKTWKSYAESLPSVGYTGGDAGDYVKRHNPFSYFSDVVNSSQSNNLVPFTQLAADLASGQLPNFSFIVPNVQNDAHNGTLGQADGWLQQNIAALIASPVFQQDGLLIIVFDESFDSDTANGGGHVPALLVGPKVKRGYQSSSFYQHQNVLSLISSALGMSSAPGAAAGASDMKEFF